MKVRPKDYVYASGFYAAVVSEKIEDGRVLTTVRYFRNHVGEIEKLSTTRANELLHQLKPEYCFYVKSMDVLLHGIPVEDIKKIFSPNDAIDSLAQLDSPDEIQQAAKAAYRFLLNSGIDKMHIGITGSIALGFHNEKSDIDMVIYGRENFKQIRHHIEKGLGEGTIQELDNVLWLDTYERRDCSLDFETYLFHEKRKLNKFQINGYKVDVSLVLLDEQAAVNTGPYKKLDKHVLRAKVIDDSQAFDLPARYYVDDATLSEIVCYTVTYAGQAFAGEQIEAAGIIETDQNGDKRLVIGTSREAHGEYIKVLQHG